jgi:hypothetical protein
LFEYFFIFATFKPNQGKISKTKKKSHMNILRPLPKDELNSFFSKYSLKVIHYFINTSLFAQPEVYPDRESLPIQIPKEHLEQWFVQALQVESLD